MQRVVEDCLGLDSNKLAKAGVFAGSYRGTINWTNGCSVGLTYHQGQLDLNYRLDGKPIQQAIAVTAAPCHFGGNRYYFQCPGCGTRRYKLHSAHSGFYCRECYGLPYYSQECGHLDGLIRQKNKVQDTLDSDRGKRMRTTTRMELIEKLCALEDKINSGIVARFGAQEAAKFGILT